jgi:hypothetical protein
MSQLYEINSEIFFEQTGLYFHHPWVGDLRALGQMLEGLISIPHLLDGLIDKEPCYFSNCDECLKALDLRNTYQRAKET